jgi:hypothetical protein
MFSFLNCAGILIVVLELLGGFVTHIFRKKLPPSEFPAAANRDIHLPIGKVSIEGDRYTPLEGRLSFNLQVYPPQPEAVEVWASVSFCRGILDSPETLIPLKIRPGAPNVWECVSEKTLGSSMSLTHGDWIRVRPVLKKDGAVFRAKSFFIIAVRQRGHVD